jgi:hypothetical protein
MSEFLLDVAKEGLCGWEASASIEVVAALAFNLLQGVKLPPVPVQKFAGNYYLCMNSINEKTRFLDGGHNRSIASYMIGNPLLCTLSTHSFDYRVAPIEIKDILLESRPKELLQRMSYYEEYRLFLNDLKDIDYGKLNI